MLLPGKDVHCFEGLTVIKQTPLEILTKVRSLQGVCLTEVLLHCSII